MPVEKEQRRQALRRQSGRVRRRLARLRARSNRFTWARLLTFVTGFVLSGVAFFTQGPAPAFAVAAVFVGAFAVVVTLHRRIEAGIARHEIWLALKEEHVARMDLDWERIPAGADLDPPPDDHPFALDLDLVGPRSVHQLLDTAVTQDGSRRLQAWLLETDPDWATIERRQALVRELVPLSLFRDKLRLHARLAAGEGRWSAARLNRWLAGPDPAGGLRRLLLVLGGLAAVNVTLFVLDQMGALPALWPFTFAVYFGLYLALGRAAGTVFEEGLSLQAALEQMGSVFAFLENYRYGHNRRLRALCAPFLDVDTGPSRHLQRVRRVVAAAGLSRNLVFWLVLNAIVPWDLFFAYRLHRLRAALSRRLPTWLDVWFELEALGSLAQMRTLNPHYTFPTITPDNDAPFDGRELGHPLIPDSTKVRNDYAVQALGRVDIVTGSNMAGKSSFLRTLGVNLALAYAGGPVDAVRLQTRLFRLFTCIRVTDSVIDGISYFYAEVKRLKALLAALRDDDPRPLFFLIDEIFRGTNNRERLIGSRAYLRSLVGERGIGAVATHDLELVQLAEEMEPVANYHFRDFVADGRMAFDYKLRPGPSPTTNALKIMEMEGLPV